jgi:small GTP-binding protein
MEECYKVVILGDSSTGKTCLIKRALDNQIDERYSSTIEFGFENLDVEVDNQIVKLALWDTAGQEQYRAIVRSFYHDVDACILVFDLTAENSLESVQYWTEQISTMNNKNTCQYFLVESIFDLIHSNIKQRGVSIQKIEDFENKTISMKYYETSAFNGYGADDLFQNVAQSVSKLFPETENHVSTSISNGISSTLTPK